MGVGTWPDWIIAVANIVMAWAALYAALNAKDWLKSNLRNEGFDSALKLRTEHFQGLKRIRDSHLSLDKILDVHISDIENILKNTKVISSLNINFDYLHRENNKSNFEKESKAITTKILNKKVQLKKIFSQLELYGWTLKPSFNEGILLTEIDRLINYLTEYTEIGIKFYNYSPRASQHCNADEIKDYFLELKKEHGLSKMLLNGQVDKLMSTIESYFSYKSIQDPFDVK
ncbi:hypothetical protein F9U39_21220 [Pectobacterium versatile]|uniref:hypothetical protein n=1 Tax=Pectobacterium versatile TaxID=2488639 RepID=UPI001B39BE61|nr:hypothetical protein [Pectobacterium versatile]MBQ4791947.1 hypothetical protein [Pectobacterium versatile]